MKRIFIHGLVLAIFLTIMCLSTYAQDSEPEYLQHVPESLRIIN